MIVALLDYNSAGEFRLELAQKMLFARSMGDQLRFGVDGPRELADSDLRSDGQPKVVVNSFQEVDSWKRKLNKIVGGVVTFGSSEPPIALYEGPTGRRALGSKTKTPDKTSGVPQLPILSTSSDREGISLGNVSRGDRI